MSTVLVGKPGGKRSLGRPRRRWEDNIKMNLREVGCDPGEWIDLAKGFSVPNQIHCNSCCKITMNSSCFLYNT